jgi:P pilus assembly chaperone PapD
VQSWIDTGDPTALPEKINVQFVIMPPITRIDAGKGQMLRLIYTGGTLADDRESIFWLNILAIPPKNPIQKLIYSMWHIRHV